MSVDVQIAPTLPSVARWRTAARSHRGTVRALNEDSFLERPDCGIWAIADGMGGHAAGDVASRKAVEAIGRLDCSLRGPSLLPEVYSGLLRLNAELHANALNTVMGTTIVSLILSESKFDCVWAGDSRAYYYSQGRFARITKDHSLVQDLVDAGVIDEKAARSHPRSNVLTRAVGASSELDLSTAHGNFTAGDRFLLCSDGLTSILDDKEIADMVCSLALSACADALLHTALSRGARDNVTLLLIDTALS